MTNPVLSSVIYSLAGVSLNPGGSGSAPMAVWDGELPLHSCPLHAHINHTSFHPPPICLASQFRGICDLGCWCVCV